MFDPSIILVCFHASEEFLYLPEQVYLHCSWCLVSNEPLKATLLYFIIALVVWDQWVHSVSVIHAYIFNALVGMNYT